MNRTYCRNIEILILLKNQNRLLEFPQKYVLSDFDYGDTQFYEMDGSNYSEIAIAGSFIKAVRFH